MKSPRLRYSVTDEQEAEIAVAVTQTGRNQSYLTRRAWSLLMKELGLPWTDNFPPYKHPDNDYESISAEARDKDVSRHIIRRSRNREYKDNE